jgi:hypothetical protein
MTTNDVVSHVNADWASVGRRVVRKEWRNEVAALR